MKRKMILLLATSLVLAGCGDAPSEDTSKDRVVVKNMYMVNPETQKVEVGGKIPTFYKANSEVPYISLSDMNTLFSSLREAKGTGNKSTLQEYEGSATITVENGAKCDFDVENQTISFDKFDEFFTLNQYKPLTLVTGTKSIKISKTQEYTQGKSYTIDLKPYSAIDLHEYGDDYYLPTQVFSDLFLSDFFDINLAYNLQDFFLLPEGTPLEAQLSGEKSLTELGRKYFSGPKKTTISEGYAQFYYQSLCFNYDHTYGYKHRREMTTFDSYLTTKGFKDKIQSTDIHTADDNYTYALSSILDHHTGKSMSSPLYEYGASTEDLSKYDPKDVAFQYGSSAFQKAKKDAGINQGTRLVKNVSGTAFINFNEFTDINEDSLYDKSEPWDLDNTQLLFADAYNKITSDSSINYVVVDLTTNDGGSISSVVYALGVLLGEIHIDSYDPFTGASLRTYYKVDINQDGVVDDKDKSLSELGKKIVFLTSKYSFSSANAMPVFATENSDKVIILGENTAGGPCALRKSYTALGSGFSQSGFNTLAKKVNEKFIDIDDGVGPKAENKDLVPAASMFNYDYIDSIIGTAK